MNDYLGEHLILSMGKLIEQMERIANHLEAEKLEATTLHSQKRAAQQARVPTAYDHNPDA